MQITPKTVVVNINGQDFQFHKMTPAIGSYIWQLLMAACFKASQTVGGESNVSAPAEDSAIKVTPAAEKLRGLCGIAFMHLNFKDYEFIQENCIKVTARIDASAGVAAAMPLMTYDGRWAAEDVADNLMLVTRLMVEALVHSLSSFLVESGAGPLA